MRRSTLAIDIHGAPPIRISADRKTPDELLGLSSTLADQANRLSTSVDQVLTRVRAETPVS